MTGLHQVEHDYAAMVDALDERLANAARLFDRDELRTDKDPLRTYWLIAMFLRGLGDYSPGVPREALKRRVEDSIGRELTGKLERESSAVCEYIQRILRPSYVAASYWSPIDRKRHSIQFRNRPSKPTENKAILAAAYAFYALTLHGASLPAGNRYYSATHYTATDAKRKQGVRVCYWDDAEFNSTAHVWHIPKSLHETILEETRIANWVRRLEERYGDVEIRQHLESLLLNDASPGEPTTGDKFRPGEFRGLAGKYIDAFSELNIARMPGAVRKAIDDARAYTAEHFGADFSAHQALFMLMTNILYNATVCPCGYYYAFPARIADTCCVMTFGTREHLDSRRHLALSRITNSIFSRALLADHDALTASLRNQVVTKMAGFMSSASLAHELSKPLKTIDAVVYALEKAAVAKHADWITPKVDAIRRVLNQGISPYVDEALRYSREASDDSLHKVHINEVVTKARQRLIERIVERKVQVKVSLGQRLPVLMMNEYRCVIAIRSLLENAIDALPRDGTGLIQIRTARVPRRPRATRAPRGMALARRGARRVRIVIQDNGPGIPAEVLDYFGRQPVTSSSGGQGVGLVIARELIEKYHGGSVQPRNVVSNGAIVGARIVIEF